MIFLSYQMLSPSAFQQQLESMVWADLLNFVFLSLGVSLVLFVFSKISG